MPKILHFADAHIDMANYGTHNPQTGLPVRVMDFLASLDTIIAAAISEKVDLVIFAGDAYKDRNPAPTFQREWGRRIMRLSQAGIPTLLLVGNHDLSPALGRAHALDAFDTLAVPHIRVLDKPAFLSAGELGIPLQVIALPWISRSGMVAHLDLQVTNAADVYAQLETKITETINEWLETKADPSLPLILTAHASIQGAKLGGERTIMLGADLVLPGSLVRDPRLDYVALGHIHKPQNINEGQHPPVIYPGSIERVDFGEAGEDKFYVIAQVEKGDTKVAWHRLDNIRPFIDRYAQVESQEDVMGQIFRRIPPAGTLAGAIFRLTLDYPRDWEPLIDEAALRQHAAQTFEFRLVKRPQIENRVRLPGDQHLGTLPPLALLDIYWKAAHLSDPAQVDSLQQLAREIIEEPPSGE
jgi:exonuclease SbcD